MSDHAKILADALRNIQEKSFSPRDDDMIWMDDNTPLGQYIDQVLSTYDRRPRAVIETGGSGRVFLSCSAYGHEQMPGDIISMATDYRGEFGREPTMRERVAMAIAESMENDTRSISEKWKFFLPQADAAMKAIGAPAKQMVGTGWAVFATNDQVDLRTVAQHRRAAIVNWLFASAGIPITRAWTDEMIEERWQALSPGAGIRVEEIGIVEIVGK